MATGMFNSLQLKTRDLFGTRLCSSNFLSMQTANSLMKPLAIEARANTRTESPKIRNRRQRKKEAATRIGEDLVKTCTDLNINKISYDRNGFARGAKMQAFEIAISRHGFLS